MLEDEEFIAWANENVVVLVGNSNGTGKHTKPGEKSAGDGEKKSGVADGEGDAKPAPEGEAPPETAEGESKSPGGDTPCTLYPGIRCGEHAKVGEEIKTPKDGAPALEVKGWPTSFVIAPDGTFDTLKEDREPGPCQRALEDAQKKVKGKPVALKKYQAYLDAIADGDKAVEAGAWKAAIAAYLKVDKDAKKLPGLAARLPDRVAVLNAKVAEAFAKVRDGELDAAAKAKAVKALRADASAKLSSGALPVVADIDAWLKANPATPPAPK